MTVSLYYLSPTEAPHLPNTLEGEMLRVALAINDGNSVEQLVDIIFETLDHLVPYDRIGVALLDPQDVLRLLFVRSKRPVIWGVGAHAPIAGSSLEPIVRQRQIRIINDLDAYRKEHPQSKTSPYLLAEGMRSSLALPLLAKNRPMGVVFFSSTQVQAYGPQHVNFLRTLAAGFGTAFERAQLLDELRQAHAELRTLDQLKTNFLSNLSHELRTPLSIVMSYIHALEDEVAGEVTPQQHHYLEEALTGADRLRTLLNDLFDFTELESGTLTLQRAEVDLGAIARDVADEAHPSLVNAGVRLNLWVPKEPIVVDGDAPRLAQVIRALMDNAGKFTPAPGEVTLRVGQDQQNAWVEVEDTGIGVAPEHQPRIFDKFFQVESGPSRTHGGTGLGLPLAKAIAEAHGGEITFRSQVGKGSTFRVTLPKLSLETERA